MAALLVVFPVGKDTEADAYMDFCDLHNPDTDPNAPWDTPGRRDRHGQRVVGFLGPEGQWNSGNYPEPAGGAEARASGVLSANVEWPTEEEEEEG